MQDTEIRQVRRTDAAVDAVHRATDLVSRHIYSLQADSGVVEVAAVAVFEALRTQRAAVLYTSQSP